MAREAKNDLKNGSGRELLLGMNVISIEALWILNLYSVVENFNASLQILGFGTFLRGLPDFESQHPLIR